MANRRTHKDAGVSTEERAEQLLGQLHQWAMEAVELPRSRREAFVIDVAEQYYEDALKNGLGTSQAKAWRDSVGEWLRALVDVIETSGGAGGGHA
jgi:hypothetical protein